MNQTNQTNQMIKRSNESNDQTNTNLFWPTAFTSSTEYACCACNPTALYDSNRSSSSTSPPQDAPMMKLKKPIQNSLLNVNQKKKPYHFQSVTSQLIYKAING